MKVGAVGMHARYQKSIDRPETKTKTKTKTAKQDKRKKEKQNKTKQNKKKKKQKKKKNKLTNKTPVKRLGGTIHDLDPLYRLSNGSGH